MEATKSARSALDAAYYEFTQDVQSSIFEAIAAVRARSTEQFPAPPPVLLLKGGYAESPGWFLVQAIEFDPEPLTVANLRVRDIYASERIVQALLEIMASEKWLDRRGEGDYYLAEQGRIVSQRSRDRRERFMEELAPLPEGEFAELESLLGRVIDGCIDPSTQELAWCVAHSRNRAPGPEAPPLDRIRQYLEDLNAFRDDAHMAAWMPRFAEGYIWEAFSYVFDGQAATGDELFDALSHRGYSRGDYADALASLDYEGYLKEDLADGRYAPTEAGREMHAKVEKMTDDYFYAPWGQLSAEEQFRLEFLLAKLRDNLRTFATTEAPQ